MRRIVSLGLIVAFLVYVGWLLAPYMRATLVRDAAVTTWSRHVVAPIAGRLIEPLPDPGAVIGQDGRVTLIRNDLLTQEARQTEAIRDRAVEAQSRFDEAQHYLSDLLAMEARRQEGYAASAEAFRAQLADAQANLTAQIGVQDEAIAVLTRVVERQRTLLGRGSGTAAALDEAQLRLAELNIRQADMRSELASVELRKQLADAGTFLTETGETPAWVYYATLEMELEAERARHRRDAAKTALEEAQSDLADAQEAFKRLSESVVTAPPGSLVFALAAAPGSTVAQGERLLEWVDCTVLMVDVPVSDAEVPLITHGMEATVVLEGEAVERKATVLLTRGSAAPLGRGDLIATAKGRTDGVAQVLLSLPSLEADTANCPVGRAAYVDFPGVGAIDIIRARLRL